jgi:thioredoxin 2
MIFSPGRKNGQYAIRSIPTLALFQNGRELARQPGAMGTADIVSWVQSQL